MSDDDKNKSGGGTFGLIVLLVAMCLTCPSEKDHREAIKDAFVKEAVEAGEKNDFDRVAAFPELMRLAVMSDAVKLTGKYRSIGLASWMTAEGELYSIGAFNHVWCIK